MDFWTLHFDGSCPKNPGNFAAYGYTIHCFAELVKEGNGGIKGEGLDNNIAEFYGFYKGLSKLNSMLSKSELIEIKGDSLLVVNIMNKKWKLRGDRPFYEIGKKSVLLLKDMRRRGSSVSVTWVPRKYNQACDYLSKNNLTTHTSF